MIQKVKAPKTHSDSRAFITGSLRGLYGLGVMPTVSAPDNPDSIPKLHQVKYPPSGYAETGVFWYALHRPEILDF